MATVSFSLTEKIIIDTILSLRAPLEPDQSSCIAKMGQGLQSEVIARIAAIFTSVFAIADAFIHFTTGVCKAADLLAKSICCWSSNYTITTVYAHFKQAAWFSGLAIAGSIAGVIWPGIFKHCRYIPSASFLDVPASIRKLADDILNNPQKIPLSLLKERWRQLSLEDKHWFVQIFNQDRAPSFKAVRTELASTVYQPLRSLRDRQIRWLSPEEIDQHMQGLWRYVNSCHQPFFYHATSQEALEAILKSRKVEVRHEKAFRGAFVSTTPETVFGRCILAFKKSIERLSPLEHGFPVNQGYWAGFSRDIPVADSTLACIILDSNSELERKELQERCKQWTGRAIEVILLQDATPFLQEANTLNMGIPSEWNSDDEKMAQKIQGVLTARALAPVRVEKEAGRRLVPRMHLEALSLA